MNVMAGRWGKLYRDITPAELCMEEAIAELGVPYRFQFPGYLYGFRFFPDFLLPTLKLIIEVDDDSHNEKAKKIADAQRTEELNSLSWQVVRCTNKEALGDARKTLRRLLVDGGRHFPPQRLATLKDGLPQKVVKAYKKPTRGAIREQQRTRGRAAHPQTFETLQAVAAVRPSA